MRLRLPGANCLEWGTDEPLPVLDRPILLSVLEYCWWWPTNIHAREQSGLTRPSPNMPRVKLFWRLKFTGSGFRFFDIRQLFTWMVSKFVLCLPPSCYPPITAGIGILLARKATRQPPKTGAISPTGDCRLERILASYLRCASLSYRIYVVHAYNLV